MRTTNNHCSASVSPLRTAALVLLGLLLATRVLAHTGADGDAHAHAGFMQGLLHPWTGLDHLAAMLAVGAWSGLTAQRWYVAPLAFASALLAGALWGLSGTQVPTVEPMIAASLVVIGLLLATRARFPLAVAAALVGVFAVFHGVAHGAELSGGPDAFSPLAGMVLSTLCLHALGIALGMQLRTRHRLFAHVAGGAVALSGGVLLTQMF